MKLLIARPRGHLCAAAPLLRRRGASAIAHQQARWFSQPSHDNNSNNSSNKPSIYDGWNGLSEFAYRVQARLPEFERYQEGNVFPPGMSLLARYLMFARLQLPTSTRVDAVEFLGGAQHAVDLALHCMFSQDVANYAFGAVAEAPASVNTLRHIMSPMCFDMFFQGLVSMKGTMTTMEMKQLDIKGAYISGVVWEKLTLADIKQQEKDDLAATHALIQSRLIMQSMAQSTTESSDIGRDSSSGLQGLTDLDSIVIEAEDHEVEVERLRLDVLVESTESVATATVDQPEQVIDRNTAALWRFESRVTHPDDIDWRILTFMERAPRQ